MRSSKNEFIKPAGRVKLAVLKNYDLRRVPGLCKYGHNYCTLPDTRYSNSATGQFFSITALHLYAPRVLHL